MPRRAQDGDRERLIAARERRGWSVGKMAAAMLTPRWTLAQWEAGRRPVPGFAVVAAELLAGIAAPPPRKHERNAEIARLWAEGLPAAQIARRIGVTPPTVHRAADRLGLPKRPAGIGRDARRTAAIQKLWREGKSDAAIAAAVGTTRAAISDHRRRRGMGGNKEARADAQTRRLAELWAEGLPVAAIADELGLPPRGRRKARTCTSAPDGRSQGKEKP